MGGGRSDFKSENDDAAMHNTGQSRVAIAATRLYWARLDIPSILGFA